MDNLSFEERVIYNMKSHKFVIVFWDYDDQHSIDPVLILSSPLEITTFQFNPKDPNIVIGKESLKENDFNSIAPPLFHQEEQRMDRYLCGT